MPVSKYRDIAEMPDGVWRAPGNPDLFRAMAGCWKLAHRTAGAQFPPGVFKHASKKAAEAQRDRWEKANVAMIQAKHRRIGKR